MTDVRMVSEWLYPRAALDGAVHAFRGICEVRVEDTPKGSKVTVVSPEAAGREVSDEFFNLALVAAAEMYADTRA